ncbi:MAG: hypothetical protein M1839_007443 [Geoglossum umbratile]|nr:MAG: hypothetical protein M1839_007443 [Geoglossum umbratile]
MECYNLNRFLPRDRTIDDVNNLMALRADLHFAFDQRVFVFVPKPVAPPSSNTTTRFVTHILQQTSEIGPLYHNASILPIRGVRSEFLLARFAWAIFPLVIPFLSKGKERVLLMVQDGSSVAKSASAEECFTLAGNPASRSRSVSPKKRTAGDTPLDSNSPRSNSPLPSTECPELQYLERVREMELERQRPKDWTASKGNVLGSVPWMMEMGYDVMEDPRDESWDEDDRLGVVDAMS